MSDGGRSVQFDVTILGRDYRVACGESERDALLEAVAHVDARMREIREGAGKVAGIERIAVMAALNIANDLLRVRRETADGAGARSPIDEGETRRRIRRMHAAVDDVLAEQDKLF